MTSRELVCAALRFEGPARVPMSLPEPYPHDFCWGGPGPDPEHPGTGWEEVGPDRWQRTDEWGNTWARAEGFSKGEVARGAVEDWDQLDEIELPDYDLPERYEGARARYDENPEKFHIGGLPGFPFNVARKIRRLDNFLLDVLAEPDRAARLLEMVEQQLHHGIRRLAEAGGDCIMFPEDWGTQDRLLVRPDVWRRMFRPGFDRLCRTARECGVHVFMHSCGFIHEVMDDLVEAGIDLFQFDQPRIYGIRRLADEFGDRVTFWCPVDIQHTLQTRDPEAIERDAREMIELLGAGGGGFIAGYYGGNEAIGLDPKWQDIACRAFVRYGAPEVWAELKDKLEPNPALQQQGETP
ncbi:MAG: uroporphyrinogen decarboxylase family protein [Candidatus Brocadiia bacterium]